MNGSIRETKQFSRLWERLCGKRVKMQLYLLEEAARRATEAQTNMDVQASRRALGLAIRNAREAAGVNRKALSKKSGVPLKVIGRRGASTD